MAARSRWLSVLIAAATICAVAAAVLRRAVGPPLTIPQDAEPIADEGDSIVQAMQKYKLDVGLWPERLEDLKPRYLDVVPSGWEYQWWPVDSPWRLMHPSVVGAPVCADSHMTHWSVGMGRGMRVLDDHPLPAFRLPASRDSNVLDNSLRELSSRSGREPTNSWHWKGWISLLIQAGRQSEAIEVCSESMEWLPDDWWPRAVRAKLLLDTGSGTDGINEYADWCDDHPRFSHFWYLSLLYRQKGDTENALAALEKMAAYPLGYHDGDTLVPDFIGYDAAAYAYVNKRPELVLALCNRWPAQLVDSGGGCVNALRALALLSLKDFDGAARCAKQVADRGGHPDWVNDFDSILNAVEKRNFTYAHESLEPPINALSHFLIEYE